MKTLRGKVTCSVENSAINPNAKINVEIRDVSLMDAPSVLLAKTELTGKTSFPFEFTIEYDETPMVEKPHHSFSVSVGIRTGDKLDYINDTNFSLIGHDLKPLDSIEMFVIPVKPYR